MSIKTDLTVNALITPERNLEAQEAAEMIAKILKGSITSFATRSEAFLDVVSYLTRFGSVLF